MASDLDIKATQVDGELLSSSKETRLSPNRLCIFSRFRLRLYSAQQSSAGLSRNVYKNLRSDVSEECSGLPELFQRLEVLLRQRSS